MKFFNSDDSTALGAIEYAQYIAFAPVVFQASMALRNLGLLKIIEDEGKDGITAGEVVKKSALQPYGVRVLLEAGLGIGLLMINEDERYSLTKVGYFILQDKMTKVNMDFVQDICYKGMVELTESIENGKPEGLKTLGPWSTIYEGLSILPGRSKESWFNFDHYYSSDSFPLVLPHVFKNNPKRILDVGGNTGKWSVQCAKHSDTVEVTIADLPGQLKMAKENIEKEGLSSRVSFYEVNMLKENAELPKGFDIIWMSQFLDCFSEDEIVSILKKCHGSLDENGQVFILELFWDRQKYKVSAFCLQMTSLYFSNIANGNSQMYHSGLFIELVEKAGFQVVETIDNIGVSHSLLKCRKK